MSDASEDPNLKAGHAPAVKVGGMRVTTHKKPEKPEEEKPAEDEAEEFEVPEKVDKHHQQILLSGAVTKGDKDFPEAAVKAIHEKRPLPTHDNRPTHSPQKIIQQPRK
ncbi:death-associated protein 1-like [Ruditapes philippinarum]|uniref:death-associated protein 1-like n=1 Tax=Ruditapes philippinarum TaxID=129788 RepID=UPI00295BF576|nr:death-associated protein 1-like [Ruditapes philippinarum]